VAKTSLFCAFEISPRENCCTEARGCVAAVYWLADSRTLGSTRECRFIGVDRKSSADIQNGAFDPYRKAQTFDEGAASRRTKTYRDFFTPIAALAIEPLLNAIRLQGGVDLLDVATGPSSLAAETRRRIANSGCAGNGPMHSSETKHAGRYGAKQKATRSDNSRYRDANSWARPVIVSKAMVEQWSERESETWAR
jgi:hypothetical protein